MLKKVFLLLVSIMIIGNVSFAVSESVLLKELGFCRVNNEEINLQTNEKVIISFDITNITSNSYSELYAIPLLRAKGAKDNSNLYLPYYEYNSKEFSLDGYETKTLTFELKLPKLPNKAIDIVVNVGSKTFLETLEKVEFNIKGISPDFNGFLEGTKEQYWKLEDGKKVSSKEEIEVDTKKNPKMVLNLTSLFSSSKKVTPKYEVYKRSEKYNSTPLYIGYGEVITFKTKEEKEVTLSLPNFLAPEKYLLKLSFIDESGRQVSNLYEYKYYIPGERAEITKISFDRDNSKIKAYIYATKELENVVAEIKIYDLNNNLINNLSGNIKLNSYNALFDFFVEDIKVDEIKAEVKLSYNGKDLGKKVEKIYIGEIESVENFTDVIGKNCEKAVKILNGAGIINGYPDNTFKPENLVTRAEISTIVTKLKELDITKENSHAFWDVSGHWAESYIGVLNKKGFVSGYPDGSFGPQNNVTYQEALTILLNSLGYKNEVNSKEVGWPSNYIQKAIELRIVEGINIENYSNSANRGDISMMTLNAYLIK